MNIYKKLLLFCVLLLFWFNSVSAKYIVEPKIEKLISNFIVKIDKKYSWKIDKEILFLENINSKINNILEKKKINSKKEKLLNDILVLFNEKIFELDYKKSLENNSQFFLESKIINDLENNLFKIKIPSYLKNSKNKILKVSKTQEFVENSEIKKISLTKYYSVKSSNFSQFKNKKWLFLAHSSWEVWFVEKYTISSKIRYSEAKNIFKWFITEQTKFFKEWNIFYSYNFKNYNFFEDKYWFYTDTLKQNNININNSILYFSEKKRYSIITDYKKNKLINSDIIYWIVDKKDFLDDLVNDKLYLTWDTDKLFIELKNKIEKIINPNPLWGTIKKEEKIKIIYNFILDNLEYTKDLDINDKKIFSWILSYKNKNWVCEWYTKLSSYSLKFAWIPDVDVIRWNVIDAQDFPKIWHAWLKIWDLYYDPTFDDPVWGIKTKKFSEYKYFWLPKDLLYANRFDYWTTPEYLKSKSLNYRKNIVNQNLSKLLSKYSWKKYLILQQVNFNKKYNIEIWKNITISQAKKILPYYEITEKSSWELVFYKNWVKKNITKFQYFTINDENLWQVLEQLNYKLDWLYLFKWNKNWKIEYRLWFNVIIK